MTLDYKTVVKTDFKSSFLMFPKLHDYRIYSNKRHGVYLIFRVSGAALIRGRRLFKTLIPQGRERGRLVLSYWQSLQPNYTRTEEREDFEERTE